VGRTAPTCRVTASSQFIHIGPDESDALAHIPPQLLFPAPRLPRGHVVMGYDDSGKCPMLVDEKCSIYAHRPLTCRTYDCRVFPAAGLDAGEDGKDLIAQQARRWRFTFADPADRELRDAVRAAAIYLRAHPDLLPGGSAATTTQQAVRAIDVHDVFLHRVDEPDAEVVRVALRRRPR
jgi:Fe-S-cluster containining protein